MAFDAGAPKDGYSRIVQQQEEYTQYLDELVHGKLEKNSETSDKKVDDDYINYGMAKSIFDGCSDEKETLQNNIKKLEEEKQQKIKAITEDAKKAGKSDEEIANLCYNIENEYAGRIKNMRFNLSRVGANALIKEQTMDEAETNYRGSIFGNIKATGDYLSGLLTLGNAYHDLGKMKQNEAYLGLKKNSIWT